MRTSTAVVAAVALAFGVAAPAVAQELEFGLTAGYNRTDWAVDAAAEPLVGTDLDARNTFSLGVFTAMGVASWFTLQPEALYTRRGTAFRGTGVLDGEEVTVDAAYETSYIQVPLLFRISFPIARRLAPFIMAGPAVAFEWGSRIKGTVSSGGARAPFEAESYEFKDTETGVVLGAGAATTRDGGTVYLNVRYEMGLSSILEPIDGENPGSVKNRAFGVLVGFSTPVEI